MKDKAKNDWRNWLADILGLKPEDRQALLGMLHAMGGDFISRSEMNMIKGVLNMREWRIRDVMVPVDEVIFINHDADYQKTVAQVREAEHSRYPVLDDSGSVCGILLAKDLLHYAHRPQEFSIPRVMRKAVREPTTKSLDSMLEDFRTQRSHMVVVMDEHAQTAGIITIEDVLEKIVGEIEDESDDEEDRAVMDMGDGTMRIKGSMSVEEFNQEFNADLPLGAGNVAGWLAAQLGHLPQEGDSCEAHGFLFRVIKANARRVHRIFVRRTAA